MLREESALLRGDQRRLTPKLGLGLGLTLTLALALALTLPLTRMTPKLVLLSTAAASRVG